MAAHIKEHGSAREIAVQPGSELIYHDDGLIEGTLTMKTDVTKKNVYYSTYLGKAHPNDGDVLLYAMRVRTLTLNISEATFDCIGTKNRADTDRIVVPVPSQEMIPIEAHKDFLTDKMCGPESAFTAIDANYASGGNGSMFQTASNGKAVAFLGFMNGAPAELRGVRMYQRNSPVLRATWYTWKTPKFQTDAVIVKNPKGAPDMADVKNWLRCAPVGVRVGGFGGDILWRCTQEYLGSKEGVSEKVYGTPIAE